MKSCLENLKVGDVIWTRGTYFEKRYKVIEFKNNLFKIINMSNGRKLFVSADTFNYRAIIKIVKAR